MLIKELEQFRDDVALPRMLKIFENTIIPEGMCCINNLEISFLDGRNYGVDSQIKASGLRYVNGVVEEYNYDETDISISDFAQAHKDCVFISDGELNIWNELEEVKVSSVIRKIDFCSRMLDEEISPDSFKIEFNCTEFLKMQYLYQEQLTAEKEIQQPAIEKENVMEKTFDIYENKNLTAEDMRKMYTGLTGLKNADNFTDEELHAYLIEAMAEKDSTESKNVRKNKYESQAYKYIEKMKKHHGPETATIFLKNMRQIEVVTDKDAVAMDINRYTVKICSNYDEKYNDKAIDGKNVLDQYTAIGSSLDVIAPLLESAFKYNDYYPPFLRSAEQNIHKKYPSIFKYLSDSHKFFKYCNEGVLSVVDKFLWDFYETNKIELDEELNQYYYVSGERFPSIICEYVSGSGYTTEEFIKEMMFPEEVVFANRHEELFDELLQMLDFELVKNGNDYNEKTDEYGIWSLKDIPDVNWGNIEGDRFSNAAGVFESLDRYIYDSVVKELYEEYGVSSDKYNTWADIVADRGNIIKSLGDNSRNVCTYLDYLDLVCNHADKINLEHCKHSTEEPVQNKTALTEKINNAQSRKNESKNDINNIEANLEK